MTSFLGPDTTDLRAGPDLHPSLLALLPLVGVWRGEGQVGYPTIEGRHYRQEVRFGHDGRPFLSYSAQAVLLADDGSVLRPAAREVGWWRAGPGEEFEVLLAHATGVVEIYVGIATGPVTWELSTDVVVRTQTAKEVTANRRVYGIVDGALLYAVDMAAVGQPLQSHLAARLERVAG
ncbi:MAG: FABP family protein [Geodermatophilaceae bacterium]|nr:FABP family protein [Geodermatophilaceae bacterium]